MAIVQVVYVSKTPVACGNECPVDVAICIPPSFIAPIPCAGGGDQTSPWNHIDGQLISQCYTDVGCQTAAWKIVLSYDDEQIAEGKTLFGQLISGVICKDCLYKLFTDLAGVPWTFTVNQEDNTITFTDQYGCETTVDIPQYEIFVDDTESIDMHITGIPTQTITADVNISGDPNTLTIETDGLLAAPLIVSDTDTVDLTITGLPAQTLEADVVISSDPNTLTAEADGLLAAPLIVADTASVDLTIAGLPAQTLEADVKISPDAGNQLVEHVNGLFVPPATITVSDTDSVDLTLTVDDITADVNISATSGNQVSINPDGLFVPAGGGLAVSDTNSVDLTLTTGTLSADVEISATLGNQVSVAGDGLLVPKGGGLTVSDTDTIDLTITAGDLSADAIIDPDVNNILVANPAGLFVPASGSLVIGTINSQTKSANGAVIAVNDLVMQTTDATFPGLVSVAAQDFAGQKTFLAAPILNSLTATRPLKIDGSKIITATQITLSSTNDVTGTLPVGNGGTGLTAVGSANQMLGVNGAATANEYKTLSTGSTGTDFAIVHAANSVAFNLPDAAAAARGVVSTGAQTLAGQKTFSSAPILDSLTASRPLKIDGSKIITATQIDLASSNDVTGVLPIANGGTALSTLDWIDFSASVNISSATGTVTAFTVTLAHYLKIGKLICMTFRATFNLTGSASTSIVLQMGLSDLTSKNLGGGGPLTPAFITVTGVHGVGQLFFSSNTANFSVFRTDLTTQWPTAAAQDHGCSFNVVYEAQN